MATVTVCSGCGHEMTTNSVGEYTHRWQREAAECQRHNGNTAPVVIDGRAHRERTLRRMRGFDR